MKPVVTHTVWTQDSPYTIEGDEGPGIMSREAVDMADRKVLHKSQLKMQRATAGRRDESMREAISCECCCRIVVCAIRNRRRIYMHAPTLFQSQISTEAEKLPGQDRRLPMMLNKMINIIPLIDSREPHIEFELL